MAFFFAVIHNDIDWSRGYEFMDKELEKIVRDARSGRRYADKLVKVYLPDGRETCLMIHIEIQGYRDRTFPLRMYVYNYRIFDRYHLETISLAVLTDNQPQYRPDEFRTGRWGCETTFRFPIAKVSDYGENWPELEKNENPFAMVVMAHLKALEVNDGQARKHQKLRLIRLLYERGYSKRDVLELFRFIDWLLVLPRDLDKQFMDELYRIEEEKRMPYITSVERIGIEKGIQQGIQQGVQQGVQQGIRMGSLKEAREMVIEALKVRFGTVPQNLEAMVRKIEIREKLKKLLHTAILTESLEAFKRQLD